MGTVSQEKFRDFLTDHINAINEIRRELDEIQSGFTSRFMEFKAQHDSTLVRLTETLIPRQDELGAALNKRIQQQYAEERKQARARREELKTLIPRTEQEVDTLLKKAQQQVAELRKLNPEFDEREEELKAEIEELRAAITDYNERIQQLNRGFGFLLNFGKIDKVDKERQKLVGQFKASQKQLDKVRTEWQKKMKTFSEKQLSAQEQWRTQNMQLSSMRTEAEHLADDGRLEQLALKRAIYRVLDDLKDPAMCEGCGNLEQELRAMLVLNHQTDNYMEGLGAVAGLIAWLGSVNEGMTSLLRSVESLIAQQKQHSAHLKPLKLEIPGQAQTYYELWGALRDKVRDDARLSSVPLEFVDTVKPTMDETLNEARITELFDALGKSLKRATSAWG